jgi:hypothetical protein
LGEAGDVTTAKIRSLARRYRDAHFALTKWNTRLDPLVAIVEDALAGLNRRALFDFISFPRAFPAIPPTVSLTMRVRSISVMPT